MILALIETQYIAIIYASTKHFINGYLREHVIQVSIVNRMFIIVENMTRMTYGWL